MNILGKYEMKKSHTSYVHRFGDPDNKPEKHEVNFNYKMLTTVYRL